MVGETRVDGPAVGDGGVVETSDLGVGRAAAVLQLRAARMGARVPVADVRDLAVAALVEQDAHVHSPRVAALGSSPDLGLDKTPAASPGEVAGERERTEQQHEREAEPHGRGRAVATRQRRQAEGEGQGEARRRQVGDALGERRHGDIGMEVVVDDHVARRVRIGDRGEDRDRERSEKRHARARRSGSGSRPRGPSGRSAPAADRRCLLAGRQGRARGVVGSCSGSCLSLTGTGARDRSGSVVEVSRRGARRRSHGCVVQICTRS